MQLRRVGTPSPLHSRDQRCRSTSSRSPLPQTLVETNAPLLAARCHRMPVCSPSSVVTYLLIFFKVMRSNTYAYWEPKLIKQSQDGGGDEITWRISPVNEQLNALSKP
nr:DNA replication ATP-dependent helicase/nuclease DNA2 [Ipomoea trifida]